MTDAALLAELDTDPLPLGYAAAGWSATPPTAGQYQAVADIINNPLLRSVVRRKVPASEILAAVTPSHYVVVFDVDTGNPVHRRYWEDMMNSGEHVDLENANIRQALGIIFAGHTATINALLALETENASRATELQLGKVTVGDLQRIKAGV